MNSDTEHGLIEVVFNRPLWQSFTYSIPQRLSGGKLSGCRVVAPFGNDRLIGYVWNDSPSTDPGGIDVKEILDRLDSTPLLPGRLMALVRWASEYYYAPPGMMMAAAHPPGIAGRAERVAELTGLIEPSHPLSSLLPRCGEVPVSILRDNLGPDYPLEGELARLETEGSVSVFWRTVSGPRAVMERMVEPAVEERVMVRRAEELRERAPRQAELLLQLATRNGPVSRSSLLRTAGASASSLEALLAKGLVRESVRRRFREPLMNGSILDKTAVPELNVDQERACSSVRQGLDRHGVFLLHGVTGSGKTEVYLRLIADVLEKGRSALVMVPEISLTPLTVSRFSRRFPDLVAVLHSGMTPGERLDSWNLIRSGRRRIAIGPRSAVFAPLRDLGIIVVDEEHDSSYKQDELPHYNGRDVAVVRGKQAGVPVLLGSASPSMESFGNAEAGRYTLLELGSRVDGIPMPATVLVGQDRERDDLLSDELLAAIGKRTARGEQSILLINRRGFSPTQMCRNCGYREECPNCGITMTYHRKGGVLRCHYCSYWKAAMVRCPRCGFNEFSHMGPGIQKVEDALVKLLPQTRVIRMDADTTRGKDAHWDILSGFAGGDGDVLLGTQMVAKGHDFPNVTLVGIIAADMGLAFPDFRAAERTFQLILQVAGRAGRGNVPGEVIVQAYDRNNSVIKAASHHDFKLFWEMESRVRKAFGYPPYGYLVRFVWSGLDKDRVRRAATGSVGDITPEGCDLSEPSEAAFPRINRRWRWNSVARSPSRKTLGRITREIRKRFDELSPKGVRLEIDVDPHNLL
ncbi:MAG: primosomal protein N' [Candidatus Fermentibacteraceae bacterium]|nr:primosomal protein N' [Candidatus Fermentibacteraceae bacterium]MBN2609352.1 primosomal protein N' [Candidatus Fermentibacteraceae bacterium]